MDVDTHYVYPSRAAEFGCYNFHRPAIIEKLTALLSSDDKKSPRIIELFGGAWSGRRYLLHAAAFQAEKQGALAAVIDLDPNGYEVGGSLKQLIEYLAKATESTEADKLRELAKRVKVETKVEPWSFLGLKVAIKGEYSLAELARFFEFSPRPIGPAKSERRQLGEILERATHQRRLILHVPDARTIDPGLRNRLLEEKDLNSRIFLAFSYAEGEKGLGDYYSMHRAHVPAWDRKELEHAIKRNFSPIEIPPRFFDFLWESSQPPARESLAGVLLRLSTFPGESTPGSGPWIIASGDERGVWVIEENWQDNIGIGRNAVIAGSHC